MRFFFEWSYENFIHINKYTHRHIHRKVLRMKKNGRKKMVTLIWLISISNQHTGQAMVVFFFSFVDVLRSTKRPQFHQKFREIERGREQA